MTLEPLGIHKLYLQLLKAQPCRFPKLGELLAVPDKHGVYIIFSPRGTVLHVGRTVRGKKGLSQRLNNHIRGNSSFTNQFFRGKGSKLRGTHKFTFIVIADARRRALLEAYAIGSLCPKHVGLGEK